MGLASYYRRFIENFAKIALPLHRITGETVIFAWDERCELAFERLKTLLTEAPVLTMFDPTQPLSLHTDASGLGLGAVLYQGVKQDKRVLVYSSQCLNVHEKNYGIPELEALAIIWAVKKNWHYLLGRHFKIVTDHHSLCSLKKIKDTKGKLGRWMLEMAEHQYDIVHKSGSLHVDADALSRCPLQAGSEDPAMNVFVMVAMDEVDLWDAECFKAEQAKGEHTEKILKELKDPKCRVVIAECYSIVNGLLYFLIRDDDINQLLVLLVPLALQAQIMRVGHDSDVNCHLGFAKTLARIRRTFYWSMMVEDIKQYCKMCDSSQKMKPLQRK